jgi:geranylgeranyl pyrophosphate synthase
MDPIAATEAIAMEFLTAGGKHSRPFITLAAYDAMKGAAATLHDGPQVVASYSNAILRTAITIETFHKASLVHDDIEDDDSFRYGQETLHRRFGLATAINVGDYLTSLGYRLIGEDRKLLGHDVAADILAFLSDAHSRLCEGQGAELIWRDATDKRLTPIDALKVYSLKTAPAFEAAFYCGLRLAGSCEGLVQPIKMFARNLGVAFQILNDLRDWQRDPEKNHSMGSDLLGGRPTLLWALALEGLDTAGQQTLISLVDGSTDLSLDNRLQQARRLYLEADVFEKAHRLVDTHQQKATQIAGQIEPEHLRRLMYYLVDTVIDRSPDAIPTIELNELTFADALPIVF